MREEQLSAQEKKVVCISELKDLAIYLEGVKAGKGNLHPLGTIHLENLWNAIQELRKRDSTTVMP